MSKSVCFDGGTPQPCDLKQRCYFGRLMTGAGMNEFLKCKLSPACGREDPCIREAGLALAATKAQAYEDNCFAKLTACGNNFKDDFCTAALYAFDAGVVADGEACKTQDCANVGACFRTLNTKMIAVVDACMAE